MAVRVQFRRDTATAWSTTNPILTQGEVGYEYDTGKFKVGNGTQGWNSLAYSSGPTGPTGPANTLSIGTVTNGATAASTITGTAPTQTLNLTLPNGATGATGATGPTGAPGGTTFTITNSGSGAYVINGSNNPTLSFIRGHRYVININAVGHPFWIQTVSGAYSSGNVYNTGVLNNGIDSGTIIVELPFNAPALYYVCQNHSVMAGSITVSNLGPTGATGATGATGDTGATGATGPNSVVAGTAPITYDSGTQTVGINLSNLTLTSPTVSGLSLSDSSIVVEGSIADAFETTLQFTNPVADVTVTVPAADTTLLGSHIATTKGDLLAATGSNAITRLPVGTDTFVLKAKSSTATGLVWVDDTAASAGSRNEDIATVDVAPRQGNWNGSVATGNVYFTFFTPRWDCTIDEIRVVSAATAATGTTFARLGLYTFDGTTATLVARTASDTSLFASTNTAYIRSFNTTGGYPATYSLLAGQRYALGVLWVGSSPATLYTAFELIPSAMSALSPRMTGLVSAQADLPATASSFTSSIVGVWGRFE